MRFTKSMLLLFSVFYFSKSLALPITDTINFDQQLTKFHSYEFTFDLMEQGFNPATDIINMITFSFDVREIVEDPFEDNGSTLEHRETVEIHDHFLYYRAYFVDLDTGVVTDRTSWTPVDGCAWPAAEPGYPCLFQPDLDGRFFSSWRAETDNLWLNSLSLTIDVTRKNVDEPSSLLLFSSLLLLLLIRLKKCTGTGGKLPL